MIQQLLVKKFRQVKTLKTDQRIRIRHPPTERWRDIFSTLHWQQHLGRSILRPKWKKNMTRWIRQHNPNGYDKTMQVQRILFWLFPTSLSTSTFDFFKSFTLSPKFNLDILGIGNSYLYIVSTSLERVISEEATLPTAIDSIEITDMAPLETCADHKLPAVENKDDKVNRLERAQWLRAAILGANDGLLSTTSLMLGVGAAKEDQWSMIISGLAGALAGACSMAVGEFVSVSTQRDIERAVLVQHNSSNPKPEAEKAGGPGTDIMLNIEPPPLQTPGRNFLPVSSPARSPVMKVVITDARTSSCTVQVAKEEETGDDQALPSPWKAGSASALAFLCGSLFPLISAMMVSDHTIRIVVIVVVTSIALALFGGVGARLGGSPLRASAARVLVGGWVSMAITYSLLKPLDGFTGHKEHEHEH